LFTYVAPRPTVTSVLPDSGPTRGGTQVTITGTNFTGAPEVRFGGSLATNVVVVNATTITAITPAHATGTVNVRVTTPGGSGTGVSLFTYVTRAPTVISVAPPTGPTAGGTAVAIRGTNLTGATAVAFGGRPATNVVVVSPTVITAVTPAHAAGPVDVTVTTPGGTATGASLFTYERPDPTVISVSPHSGTTEGGTAVTITGRNLTGATAVRFGGTPVTSFTVVDRTTITATTPPHAAGGVNVQVTTPGGTATGFSLYTYVAPRPDVLSVSPDRGPVAGGTRVTITGSNFTGATRVVFGNAPATNVVVVNATTITAVTPAHVAGAVSVRVVTPSGSGGAAGAFTYIGSGRPTIASISPSTGPVTGGTRVTITGTGFSGATSVNFGGAAASFTVLSATTITAVTPPHSEATVNVRVTTPRGAATAVSAFTYTPASNPDSDRLRSVQIMLTKIAAQASGAAISGAVGAAVSEGLADDGEFVSQNGDALRFNFGAEPRARGEDALASAVRPADKNRLEPRKDWRLWAEVRGTDWSSTPSQGDIRGGQVNAFLGVTRKLSDDFLIGLFGGYETLGYETHALSGRLDGDGWTFGGYFGWRVLSGLRVDGSISRAGIDYDVASGPATGAFEAQRWVGTFNVTGTTRLDAWTIEPSAGAYVVWERDDAYTDNLGVLQQQRDFSVGRASAGAKATYPFRWTGSVALAPYVGLYADYYFSSDSALLTPLVNEADIQGWAARVTTGISADINGNLLSFGAELGGLGSEHLIAVVRGRFSVRF
jgi:outer membrane autotransporter protein